MDFAGRVTLTRVVSVLGIPGSGKTTVAKELARQLGAQYFGVGEALRSRSQTDSALRDQLASGQLADEAVVDVLLSAALRSTDQPIMILDGYPRHLGQLPFALTLPNWRMLILRVPVVTAHARIRARRRAS